MRRWVRGLCVVVIVVVVAGFAWAVRPGRDRVPTVSLGDGFTVAEGSELLGDVFPLEPTLSLDGDRGSWVAHFRVTGNSVKVMNAYLEQARRAKYETAAQCVFSPPFQKDPFDTRQLPWVQVSDRLPKRSRERDLTCEGLGVIRDRGSIVGLVRIDLIQGQRIEPVAGKGPGGIANGLTMTVTRVPVGVEIWDDDLKWAGISELPMANTVDRAGGKVDPRVWPRSLPGSWERGVPGPPRPVVVPVAGQRFYPTGSANQAWKVPTVEEGTKIVALVGRVGPCGPGKGVVLVGKVVGDRDAALQAYARQLSEVMFPGEKYGFFDVGVSESTFRGQRVTVVEASSVESGQNSTTIVAVGGERPWLRIISCRR